MNTGEVLQIVSMGVMVIGAVFALRFNVASLNKIVDKLDTRISALEMSDRKREIDIALLTEPPRPPRKGISKR